MSEDNTNWEEFEQQTELASQYARLKSTVYDNMLAAGFSEEQALKAFVMILTGKTG